MNDLYWHFLGGDRRMRYPPYTLVEAGQTYTAEGPLAICQNGMHACAQVLDALCYAPGGVVCRVRLSGEREYPLAPLPVPNAAGELVDRAAGVDLHEAAALSLDGGAHLRAHRPIGRDSGDDHRHPVAGQQAGDETEAADVGVASFLGKAEIAVQGGADLVAIEDFDLASGLSQRGGQPFGDSAFAGP